MKTRRLVLQFDCDQANTQSKFEAGARVAIKLCTTDARGIKYISPTCATFKEFHFQVEKLKSELDSTVEEAYKKFTELDDLFKK